MPGDDLVGARLFDEILAAPHQDVGAQDRLDRVEQTRIAGDAQRHVGGDVGRGAQIFADRAGQLTFVVVLQRLQRRAVAGGFLRREKADRAHIPVAPVLLDLGVTQFCHLSAP